MKLALQSLIQVPGVLGAAVFSSSGACLAEILEPPYEPILLTEVLGRLREALENYVAVDDAEVGAAALIFEEGHCLIRITGGITVAVLASNAANIAMLGVALNVAALKCARSAGSATRDSSLEISPRTAHGSDANTAVVNNSTVVESVGGSRQQRPKAKKKKKKPVNTSLSVSWAVDGYDLPPPPGAVGLVVMRHVLKSLMRQIGREGKPLLEEELHRIGATPATVTAGQFTDLIVSVARRIPSPGARDAFMSDALGDTK